MFEAESGEAGGPDQSPGRGEQERYREAVPTPCIGVGQVVWCVPMGQLYTIAGCCRWLLGIGLTIGISLGAPLPYAGAAGDRPSVIGSSDSDMMTPAAAVTEMDKRWVPSAPIPGDSKVLIRTIPNVSKQISVGGTTLVPYIGAGFRGGYATDFDRLLSPALSSPVSSSSSTDVGLRSLAGQMIPNEVQVGIRFPF